MVIVDLPLRHDLESWSCVNEEIRRTNSQLKELSCEYPNVDFVEASSAERHLHTRHGMHFNSRGKRWLALKISKVVNKENVNPETDKEYSMIPTSVVSLQPPAENNVLAQETLTPLDQPSTSGKTSPSKNGIQPHSQSSP